MEKSKDNNCPSGDVHAPVSTPGKFSGVTGHCRIWRFSVSDCSHFAGPLSALSRVSRLLHSSAVSDWLIQFSAVPTSMTQMHFTHMAETITMGFPRSILV
jgi:hypothetical protein